MSERNGKATHAFENLQQDVIKPTRKVRKVPAYVPFPVDALPSPIREFVVAQAEALGCDTSYVALPALAAAAAAIGNSRAIRLKRGWKEPSVLWAVIVGESGTIKSPAHDAAINHLFRKQRELLQEYKREAAVYPEKLQAWKEKKKAHDKDKEADDPGEKPEAPVKQRLITSDVTIEKLAEILEDNPRGVLTGRDELSAWFGSFSRYKAKGAGSDMPNWLEMYRAGTLVVDRKTGDRTTLFIRPAAVSVAGSIQPGTLTRALTDEAFEAGLAARLLMAWPPRRMKRWTEAEVAEEIEDAYTNMLDSLLALPMEPDKKTEEKAPYVLMLSPGGKAAWIEWYNDWAKEQHQTEGDVAATLSKLEGTASRFALIHHVVTHVGRGRSDKHHVERQAIEAGVKLARWFANEARRIYTVMTESEEGKELRQLIDFIRNRHESRVTARELQNSNSRKYPDKESAEAALEALVKDGLGQWIDQEKPGQGGRRKRWLVLLPTFDVSDVSSDGEESGSSDVSRNGHSYHRDFSRDNGETSEMSNVGNDEWDENGASACGEAQEETSDETSDWRGDANEGDDQ